MRKLVVLSLFLLLFQWNLPGQDFPYEKKGDQLAVENKGKIPFVNLNALWPDKNGIRYCGTFEYDPSEEELLEVHSDWRFIDTENEYLNIFLKRLEQKGNATRKIEGNVIVEFLIDPAGFLQEGNVLEMKGNGGEEQCLEILNLILKTMLPGKVEDRGLGSRLVFSVDFILG